MDLHTNYSTEDILDKKFSYLKIGALKNFSNEQIIESFLPITENEVNTNFNFEYPYNSVTLVRLISKIINSYWLNHDVNDSTMKNITELVDKWLDAKRFGSCDLTNIKMNLVKLPDEKFCDLKTITQILINAFKKIIFKLQCNETNIDNISIQELTEIQKIREKAKNEKFEKKPLLVQNKMSLDELREYKIQERRYNCATVTKEKGIFIRKLVFPLLKFTVKVQRLATSKNTIEFTYDDEKTALKQIQQYLKQCNINKPGTIYAVTHTGKYDTEIAMEALDEHAYVLMGDPEQLYRKIEGIFLDIFGTAWLELNSEIDKQTVKERTIKLLKQGASLIWNPEGIWNPNPVKIILDLKYFIIIASMITKASIVPVAIEKVGNKFYLSKGNEFNVVDYINSHGDNKNSYIEAAKYLQSLMAAEQYKNWERIGVQSRNDMLKFYEFSDEWWDEYLESLIETWPEFTIEDLKKRVYTYPDTKKTASSSEAFEHLLNINYDKNNAYLLNNLPHDTKRQLVMKIRNEREK